METKKISSELDTTNELETSSGYFDNKLNHAFQSRSNSPDKRSIDQQNLDNESELETSKLSNSYLSTDNKTNNESEWLYNEISSLEIISEKWVTPKDYFGSIVQKGYRLNREFKNGDSIIELNQLEQLQKEIKDYTKGTLFFFKITTATKEWSIVKNYQEFENLQKQYKSKKIPSQPSFIKNYDNLLKGLGAWLLKLRENSQISMKYGFYQEFIGLSKIHSFTDAKIFKQGYINKRHLGKYNEGMINIWCRALCSRWRKRWTAVSEEGICYIYKPDDDLEGVGDMLLFDKTIKISFGRINTGKKNGAIVYTTTKKFFYETTTRKEFYEFLNALFDAIQISPYVKSHRFNGSFPIRENNEVKAYINSEHYFSDVYDAMNSAKFEIFIRAWWLCPEIYQKRPVEENEDSRLDKVQLRAAERGVKIYIIIFKEMDYAMPNDSAYIAKKVSSLHANINILRHPTQMIVYWSHHEKNVIIDQKIGFLGGVDLAIGRYENMDYHLFEPKKDLTYFKGADFVNPTIKDSALTREYEKCMIDQTKQPRMPWRDIHMMIKGPVVHDLVRSFSQYWNFVKNESVSLKKNHFVFPKKNHFILLKKKLADAGDKLKKIVRRNYQDKSVYINMDVGILRKLSENKYLNQLLPSPKKSTPENLFEETIATNPEDSKKVTPIQINSSPKQNFKKFDLELLDNENEFQETEKSDQDPAINEEDLDQCEKRSFEKNLKSRDVNTTGNSDTEKLQEIVTKKISKKRKSLQSFENAFDDMVADAFQASKKKVDNTNQKPELKEILPVNFDNEVNVTKKPVKIFDKVINSINSIRGYDSEDIDTPHLGFTNKRIMKDCNESKMTCQILRSAGQWSLGLQDEMTEQSIHLAFIQLIKSSENFIYIEQQFFISSYCSDIVSNQVVVALYNRIKEAITKNQRFKVLIVLPQKPGFEGEYDKLTDQQAKQLFWHQNTISKGGQSLLERISVLTKNPNDYIQFIGLRTHEISPAGLPTTEQIYVHSKMILVDDKIAMIGSANINDRSLLGNRDAEINMVIEDTKKIDTIMNGQKYLANEFCYNLRIKAMCSIFDCSPDKIMDPLNEDMWDLQNNQMTNNVRIYREIFACIPDNQITKFSDIKFLPEQPDAVKYEKYSSKIKGYAVHFPHKFLKDEDLTKYFMNDLSSYVVPDYVFC